MKKYKLLIFIALMSFTTARGQIIMFDDFNYSGVDDPKFSSFNKWSIVDWIDGPPDNAQYEKTNINFINDTITLRTTVNGLTNAITHARIETVDYEYFEGTYAAKVYFVNTPQTYQDANIQTFYTIVDYTLGDDPLKYSENDFEYMAYDQWGTSSGNKVMYMTSWNCYDWNADIADQNDYQGWHTYVFSCTDNVHVKYWIDGLFMGQVSTAANGSSVYPRSPMQIAFANWVFNNSIGNSTSSRNSTMKVDWVFYIKDLEKTTAQINNMVDSLRNHGICRKNLLGQQEICTTTIVDNKEHDETIVRVFPNPAKDFIKIKTSLKSELEILNIEGQIVRIIKSDSADRIINISELSSGLYIIKAKTDMGIIVRKFVKQ